MFDRFGSVVFAEVDPAQQQVGLGMVGFLQQDAFGTHGSPGGVALQKQHPRHPDLGVGVAGIQSEHALKRTAGLVELELIQAGMAMEQEQRDVVWRLLQGVADGLEG
jgi:hypothetical protein